MSLPHPAPIDFTLKRVRRFRNLPHGEPELVQAFFAPAANGFYVDVGANHPTEDSQSWHLECMGWRGLLIEPLPHYCEMLKTSRSGTVIQVACSSPINDGKTMPMLVAGVQSTLNAWYVPQTEGYTLSLFARWQMWRKYWLGLWWRQLKYRR